MTLRDYLAKTGFGMLDPIFDGEYHHAVRGGSKASAWFRGQKYILKNNKEILRARFGDFRTGESYAWDSTKEVEGGNELSPEEQKEIEEKTAQAKAEKEKRQLQEAEVCTKKFCMALPYKDHPYLQRKNISGDFGQKLTASGDLLIPLKDTQGKIWTLQTIDAAGTKIFHYQGRSKRCFHILLGDISNAKEIYIAEGFATAASIAEALYSPSPHGTPYTAVRAVVCAFNAPNLVEVSKEIRSACPSSKIFICADNDAFSTRELPDGTFVKSNPGLEAGKKAAFASRSQLVYPDFVSPKPEHKDFNDLHSQEGLDAVKKYLAYGRPLNSDKKEQPGPTAMDFVSWEALQKMPDEVIPWIVEGFLPDSGTGILAGQPKAGKSTLARQLAVCVASGVPFLGFKVSNKAPVLYIAVEERLDNVKQHFKKLGAPVGAQLHVCVSRASEGVLEVIRAKVKETGAKLVILDPIMKILRADDVNDYSAVNAALEPLGYLARESGAAILAVHHAGKGEADGAKKILGSSAFQGAVDQLFILTREDTQRYLESEQRYGDWLEKTGLNFDTKKQSLSMGATKKDSKDERTMGDIVEFLYQTNEALQAGDIVTGTGHKKQSVIFLLSKMTKEGRLIRRGKGVKNDPALYEINAKWVGNTNAGDLC